MSNECCHIQIMEELLTNNQSWRIEDNSFKAVRESYFTCLNLLWIEEKLNIVSGNFYEWEQEIKKSYDFLLKTQSDRSDCDLIMKEHGTKEIIILNRLLFNVVNSIRMYRDQVLHDLSGLGGDLKSDFEKETNRQYDKSFSYQIMELFRNYMQHQGLVIERITAIIPFFNREVGKELLYFAESNYTSIKNIEKFDKKIKNKPETNEKMKWINLIGILREYYTQILDLHKHFRKITEEILNKSITNIQENVQSVYGNLSVKIVAFYGKKDCEELQDFLLQMTYIERLKKYREKDVTIDTTQYYTASKCFLESDNINVSNSVRCNFRYNM